MFVEVIAVRVGRIDDQVVRQMKGLGEVTHINTTAVIHGVVVESGPGSPVVLQGDIDVAKYVADHGRRTGRGQIEDAGRCVGENVAAEGRFDVIVEVDNGE